MMRGEKVDGVVAPVIDQAHVHQPRLRNKHLHWQKFYGRDSDSLQMFDSARMRERGIGSANVVRQIGVATCQTAGVRLIDDRLRHRRVWFFNALPIERAVEHYIVKISSRLSNYTAGVWVDEVDLVVEPVASTVWA